MRTTLKTPIIYLETSAFNFPFTDDAPQYRADTLKLFAGIKAGKWKPITSKYATDELAGTKDIEKRTKMTDLITEYNITVFEPSDEIIRLTEMYVLEGVIPDQ